MVLAEPTNDTDRLNRVRRSAFRRHRPLPLTPAAIHGTPLVQGVPTTSRRQCTEHFVAFEESKGEFFKMPMSDIVSIGGFKKYTYAIF